MKRFYIATFEGNLIGGIVSLEEGDPKITQESMLICSNYDQLNSKTQVIDKREIVGDHVVLTFRAKPISPNYLTNLKKKKHDEINAERDQRESSGFTYLDKVFDSDRKSLTRITIFVQKAQNEDVDFSQEWTCKDNSTIVLSKAQILQLPSVISQYMNQLHDHAQSLKQQLQNAETEDQILAIVW